MKYDYAMMDEGPFEVTKEWVDKLWDACVKHKMGEPFTVDLAKHWNEKAAELLRARGFHVVCSQQLPTSAGSPPASPALPA